MKYFSSLIIFFLPAMLFAQQTDITGLWKGEIYVDSTKQILPYEIAVTEEKGKLKGYSRIVFTEEGIEEAGFENITLTIKGNNITINDEGFFEHNFTKKPPKRVKKEMNLVLTITDTEMIMQGKWQTNRTRFYLVATGTALLKRKKDFQESALFKKLDSLKLSDKLSFTKTPPAEPVVAKKEPAPQPKPEPVPEPIPEPEPPVLAAIAKPQVASLPIPKTRQPSIVKVERPSRQKKQLYDLLAKKVIIKPVVADVAVEEKSLPAEKPAPPKPVVKPAPPAPAPVAKAPEKKPEPVTVKAEQPKPVAPPVVQPVIAPSVIQGAAEIEKRVTKSDQSFYFQSDSLVLTLYDNGDVDGDTVTVLMNGNIIFSKAGLTTKANTKTVYITPDMDSVNLVMYAESLGEIPPNTGLLIVNDGNKRYDVRFSADLKTNAAIILRRRKDK